MVGRKAPSPKVQFLTHLTPEGNTDLLHLLGADIVSTHDEALGVPGKWGYSTHQEDDVFNLLIKESGELGEVVRLPGSLVLPNHLECELGYLDGFKDSGKGVMFNIQIYSTSQ